MVQFDFNDFSKLNSHVLNKAYITRKLKSCNKAWLKVDNIKKPLNVPNINRPYKVLCYPQNFLTEVNDSMHNEISIKINNLFIIM